MRDDFFAITNLSYSYPDGTFSMNRINLSVQGRESYLNWSKWIGKINLTISPHRNYVSPLLFLAKDRLSMMVKQTG